jgi:Tol biopolymer transport system component
VRTDLGAIAFSRLRVGGRGSDLVLWERAGGRSRQLTDMEGMVEHLTWSRDQRWIVFQRSLESHPEGNELWRVAEAGGDPRRFMTGDGPSWGASLSPDGERVVYAAFRAGRWHLAVAGIEEPERLLDVPPEIGGYVRWPDFSPDGKCVAYERMRYQTNVWTLDLAAPGASSE